MTATDNTEAGPQSVLPGAERIPEASLAQRRADQPLRPRAAQKPLDIGLFSDDKLQTDLIDLLRQTNA